MLGKIRGSVFTAIQALTYSSNAPEDRQSGKYEEGHAPKPGAVLVFRSQGRMKLGHVAVVSQIITDRYIQVTHANWSPINGRRGQVEDHVNVMDVSEKGDWSKVKVWFGPLNDLGTTVYTTYGFIYQDGKGPAPIAQPDITPMTQRPVQIADATPVQTNSELPADLKAALSPGNNGFLGANNGHAVTVAAKVTGKPAAELVAQIDADHPEATAKPEKAKVKSEAETKTHETKAESASKVRVHTRTHRH